MTTEITLALLSIAMTLMATLAGVWWQRNLAQKDQDHQKWRNDIEARMSKVQDHQVDQDLASKDLITRNELNTTMDKVFAEFRSLRTDMDSKFKDLQTVVLNALGNERGRP